MQHFHSFEEVDADILRNAYFLGNAADLHDADELRRASGLRTWAAIGTFDGVHRGHQAILAPMVQGAHAAGALAAVVTFYPHPVVVLRGLTEPMCLTTPDERARLLGELGVDLVLTLNFTRELASWSAEEFMQQMRNHLGLTQLWAGTDFALGRNRQGDLPTLRSIGQQLGYTVQVTDDVVSAGERISSSRIRALVRQGDMEAAASLLGRPYTLEGPVAHGDERGRTLGFPTANVAYHPQKIIPPYGVYATWTEVPSTGGWMRQPSVTSIGLRPTFDPPILTPRVEAYLIDFSGDLYNQVVRVEFLKFLRPELRFDSAQALIDQMVVDTQNAREVLAHA